MKKLMVLVLTLTCAFGLVGCEKNNAYKVKITIPAESTEDFVYSDVEISPTGNTITISSGDGLGDTEVVLKPIEAKEEIVYVPTYHTPGMPVKMDVEKGAWFQIGVLSMKNPANTDIVVSVEVEGVEVRME